MYRAIQKKTSPAFRGLALGWGIPNRPDVDSTLIKALPDWAIVTAVEAPLTVTWTDVLAVRKLARVQADVPVILFGWGLGAATVSAALIGNVWPSTPWAVAVLNGSHPSGLRDAGALAWRVTAARAGQLPFLASQPVQAQDKPQDGKPWSCGWVLGAALGTGPEGKAGPPPADVTDGALAVVTVRPAKDASGPPDLAHFALLERLAAGPRS